MVVAVSTDSVYGSTGQYWRKTSTDAVYGATSWAGTECAYGAIPAMAFWADSWQSWRTWYYPPTSSIRSTYHGIIAVSTRTLCCLPPRYWPSIDCDHPTRNLRYCASVWCSSAYAFISLRLCYAMSGTALPYGAMQCAVLSSRMVVKQGIIQGQIIDAFAEKRLVCSYALASTDVVYAPTPCPVLVDYALTPYLVRMHRIVLCPLWNWFSLACYLWTMVLRDAGCHTGTQLLYAGTGLLYAGSEARP
eukprot:1130297-Rhodomonas_salina.3